MVAPYSFEICPGKVGEVPLHYKITWDGYGLYATGGPPPGYKLGGPFTPREVKYSEGWTEARFATLLLMCREWNRLEVPAMFEDEYPVGADLPTPGYLSSPHYREVTNRDTLSNLDSRIRKRYAVIPLEVHDYFHGLLHNTDGDKV